MTLTLPWLAPDNLKFPDIEDAWEDPNGLLAAGGDLSPARLIEAYRRGIFPWYEDDQPILWWSPHPRMLLFSEELHTSRSLRKVLRLTPFEVSIDQAFAQVIEQCSLPRREQGGTWITPAMKTAYIDLHQGGVAHSLEIWQEGSLVGGIYGVAIGRAFFGESMFSRVSNASKVALVILSKALNQWNFGFIDCQMETSHLRSMGARAVARDEFKKLLLHYTGLSEPANAWQLNGLAHDLVSENPIR